MKKKVFREKYYGDIEHNGENFGNKEVKKEETTTIKVEEKPAKKVTKKTTKKGK